ncbi:hypothetical protein L7F22_046816 [Adiantum nelumboides]|nr:hypothetical protein [Adiantum nelumboides]
MINTPEAGCGAVGNETTDIETRRLPRSRASDRRLRMAVRDRESPDHEDASSSFYLAKCILKSSVVLQAVHGHIRSPTTLDIVFGKLYENPLYSWGLNIQCYMYPGVQVGSVELFISIEPLVLVCIKERDVKSSQGVPSQNVRARNHSPSISCHVSDDLLPSSAVLETSAKSREPWQKAETSLELVVLSEDGVVQSLCEQPVFGKIKNLKVLPWNEQQRSFHPQTHGKDLLVITSDSGKMSFLTFCVELHRFLAVAHVQISQPGNARRELGSFLAVESRGQAIAVSALEDKIAIYPTSIIAGNNIVEKRITYPRESWEKGEHTTLCGTVWSMAFVPGSAAPGATDSNNKDATVVLIVLVHRKGAIQNELLILSCDMTERSIQLSRFSPISPPGPLAYLISDVPAAPGLAILFRYGDILLLKVNSTGSVCVTSSVQLPSISSSSHEKPGPGGGDDDGSCNEAVSALLELVSRAESTMQQPTEGTEPMPSACIKAEEMDETLSPLVCAWAWSLDAPTKSSLMLSMDTGELFLLHLVHIFASDFHLSLSDCLYHSPPLKDLLWMKDGFIAALGEMGDGQVLQLKDGCIDRRSTIENISPTLDFSLVDYHNERQDQMFACAGAREEGSLRVVRNGVSVEKLISTGPLYEGVTGSWTMKFCREDAFHSFLVLSFVEETRVLSVGLSFNDITDDVGFNSLACTLACGWIEDGWVAQVCINEVRICAPTTVAHPKGLNCLLPLSTCWMPSGNANISLGAVSFKRVILATSRPGLLLMLGLRSNDDAGLQELVLLQQCIIEAELSCISIPQEEESVPIPLPPAIVGLLEKNSENSLPSGIEVGKVFVVGTHKPSVEVLSMVPGDKFTVLAVGHISLINTMETALSGCVPEDVRLVLFDRPYILAGLRNGMLLRFEWPMSGTVTGLPASLMSCRTLSEVSQMESSSFCEEHITWSRPVRVLPKIGEQRKQNAVFHPTQLHLIAVRRMGVSPVSLIPLQTSLRADVIALGDRPWLLQTARHSERIACTSISFQPSTHGTAVKSKDCTKGVLFVADRSLHLVEMEHSKRLNVERLTLGSTPRKIVYHGESKTLLVMRSDWCGHLHGYVSDICCIDPVSGLSMFSYRFDHTETPKCMQLCKIGSEHLLLVGTGLTTGKAIMANGEPDGAKGRLIVFQLLPKQGVVNSDTMPASEHDFVSEKPGGQTFVEGEGLKIIFRSHVQLSGVVLAVAPYLDQYVLACAGNNLSCLGFSPDGFHRLKRYDSVKTRFVITCMAVNLGRIAVGDCRDGISLYTYQEYESKLEQLYCDPMRRLVADCTLVDQNTAMVTDRHGNFSVLSCGKLSEDSSSPERNLISRCWYHMGEVMLSISKGHQTHEVGESSRPPQTEDEIFRTQLVTAVAMFTQVMQNPRFMALLQPPPPSQSIGNKKQKSEPAKAQPQEEVAGTPVLQAVPVQPATFQQPIAGCNGQGSDLQAMQQGSLAYKVLLEDNIKTCNKGITREYQFSDSSVIASTLLGSVVVFVRLTREEYELLDAVQNRLALYPLTSPLLGNNHAKFRGRGCPAGAYKVLDGDMLGQFLELTSSQQRSVLADQPGSESLSTHNSNLNWSSKGVLSVEEVLRLLDLVHNSLT